MPTETIPLPEQNILFVRCFGQVEPPDIIDWRVDNRIFADQDNRLTIVVDLSGVTGTDMTFEHMNATHGKLSRHYQARDEQLHLLLFAPEDLVFGMTRIMQSLSAMTDYVKVDVFRKQQELAELMPDLPYEFHTIRRMALDRVEVEFQNSSVS